MNLKIVKRLSTFVRKTRELKDITPYEYVQKLTETKHYCPEEYEVETCLSFIKHEKFLSAAADTFIKRTTLSKVSKFNLSVLMYMLIFDLEKENVVDVLDTLRGMKNPNTIKLLSYLANEDDLIMLAQDACKIFDSDFVLNTIINPLLDKAYLLKYLEDVLEEEKQQPKKPLTVPDRLRVLERPVKALPVPDNTPLPSVVNIFSTPLPISTYKEPSLTLQLQKQFEKNKLRAVQLLEVARRMAPKSSLVKKREEVAEPQPMVAKFKAKRAPPKKEVNLKQNFTTVIREAAVHIRNQEDEVKRIESLINGGFDPEKFKRIEIDFHKAREEELLAEIEKKKLKCMITREEAILAKKNLYKTNRAKTLQYHRERMKILQDVEMWKKDEELRIREQVDKVHEVEGNAREATKKLQETKQANARYAKYESKKLQDQIMQERQQEVQRKAELIKEIKTLHQVRAVHVKEYDPTECPNLGLLCEMSIAELQERLVLLTMTMSEELEEKKRKIAYQKKKHRQFVEDAKMFVEQARQLKVKTKKDSKEGSTNSVTLDEDPEVMELRNRLQAVKTLRQNA